MPRPVRKRIIDFSPTTMYFKPAGIYMRDLDEVVLAHEELEALRLQELLEQSQERAAQQMDISQPTFHRLINVARKKIVDALVNGKAIKIEGGHYIMKNENVDPLKKLIAISSSSNNLEGDVDSRFGRCKYFLLVSLENGKIASFEAVENTKTDMRGGVGIAIAQMLAEHNIDSIISGNIGPRALDVLQQFQISTYQFNGSKQDAVKKFFDKKLEPIQGE